MKSKILAFACITAVVWTLSPAFASTEDDKAASFERGAQYDLTSATPASPDPASDPTTVLRVLNWQGAFRAAKNPATGNWVETADTYVTAAAVGALVSVAGDDNHTAARKGADYLTAEQYSEKDGVTTSDKQYGGIRLHAPGSLTDTSGNVIPTANVALSVSALHAIASEGAPATLPLPYVNQTLGLPEDYAATAQKAADYLVRIQKADGSFPLSYDPETGAFKGPATARNAALAIRALITEHKAVSGDKTYLEAAKKAATWLATLQVIGVNHDGGFRSTGDPTRADYNIEFVYETGIALDAFTALAPLAPTTVDYALAFQKGFSFLNQQKTGFGSGTVESAGFDLTTNKFLREITSSGTAWTLIFYADYQTSTGITVSSLPSTLDGEKSLQNPDGSFARIEPDGTSPLEWVEDTALGLAALKAAGA